VFGAANPPAAPSQPAGKQTMVFGAANPPADPSQPAGKQTMVFGAANPPAAPAQPAGKQTMVFGAANAPAAAQPAGKQTMVFGAVPPSEAPAAPPASNRTMMFGRAPGAATPAEAPQERSESTVRVDLEAVMRGQGAEDFDGVQARHDRTQRYAMTEPGKGPTPPPAESVEARHNRTQLFAMTSQQETTKPDANAPAAPSAADWGKRPGDSTLPPSFAEMPTLEPEAPSSAPPAAFGQTLMFGARGPQPTTAPGLDPPGVRVLLEPGMATPPEAQSARPEPTATTLPNLAPIERAQELPPLRVDLPPEPGFQSGQVQTQRNLPVPDAADDAAMAELQKRSGRRTALAVIVFLVVALGLGLALLWHLFGRTLLGANDAAFDRQAVERAVALLRMDDADSRAQAMGELKKQLEAKPNFVEARAALAMAEAFAFDDAGAFAIALQEKARQGRADAQAVEDAQSRVMAAKVTLQNELDALKDALKRVEPGSEQERAVLRGIAVALGTLGDPQAVTVAQQFYQSTKDADDWVDLAMPEYQAVAGKDVLAALKQLEEIRGRRSNSTFFRVLVLTARLQLKASSPVAAEEALKTVTTLNSKHELAALMLDVLARQYDAAPRPAPSAARNPALDGK